MSRFLLSRGAERDLLEIREYLDDVPEPHSKRIGSELRSMLTVIGDAPFLGRAHSDLTLLAGQEVRSRRVGAYRIFYLMNGKLPEILGIVHTSRDLPALIEKRLH